jgi:hypothetical protein
MEPTRRMRRTRIARIDGKSHGKTTLYHSPTAEDLPSAALFDSQ